PRFRDRAGTTGARLSPGRRSPTQRAAARKTQSPFRRGVRLRRMGKLPTLRGGCPAELEESSCPARVIAAVISAPGAAHGSAWRHEDRAFLTIGWTIG